MSIRIEKLKNGIPVLMDKIDGINSVTLLKVVCLQKKSKKV